MKTVIFFRHGKSDWDANFGEDHERPINKRGRKAGERMGKFLADAGQLPDRIITSSAVRARATLERAVQEGEWGDVPTIVTRDLYEASIGDVLRVIQSQDDGADRILLVGHEPTWSDSIGRLIGGGRVKMSTGTMACIDFDLPGWQHVDFGAGVLRWLVPPKSLD